MSIKDKPLSFERMNLIPISEAAKRYNCSVRHLERKGKAGKFYLFKPGKQRVVDTTSADIWFFSTLEGPRRDEDGNVIRRGAPRKR